MRILLIILMTGVLASCTGQSEDNAEPHGVGTDSGTEPDTGGGVGTEPDTGDGVGTDSGTEPDTGGGVGTGGVGTEPDTGDGVGTEPDTDTIPVAMDKSCKRGVAYGHHSVADMSALSKGISWWTNWFYAPEAAVSSVAANLGVAFVPMWWGTNIDLDAVATGLPSDAVAILGFNEPNFFAQSNLSAINAAMAWPGLEAIADAKGLSLVSPAVNYCGGGCYDENPVSYLNDFFAACTDCRVDAVAIHIYVECDATSAGLQTHRAQWLINQVEMYKDAFDQPLWLTEFACSGNPTVAEQQAFMADAVAYLENEPRIVRYAWFSGRADNMVNVDLLDGDGVLTPLGQTYVNAPFNTAACPAP